MTASDEPRSELGGEGLEAAVARWNAARAEDGEV
jgi:hypothetical protein